MFNCRLRIVFSAAVALLAFAGRGADAAGTVLTNCRQVIELSAQPTGEADFAIHATVSFSARGGNPDITPSSSIEDSTGALSLSSSFFRGRDLRPGDTARFLGAVVRNQYGEAIVTLSNITDLVHGPAPTPKDASFDEIKSGDSTTGSSAQPASSAPSSTTTSIRTGSFSSSRRTARSSTSRGRSTATGV